MLYPGETGLEGVVPGLNRLRKPFCSVETGLEAVLVSRNRSRSRSIQAKRHRRRIPLGKTSLEGVVPRRNRLGRCCTRVKPAWMPFLVSRDQPWRRITQPKRHRRRISLSETGLDAVLPRPNRSGSRSIQAKRHRRRISLSETDLEGDVPRRNRFKGVVPRLNRLGR